MPGMFATAATEVTRLTNQRRRSEGFVLTARITPTPHVTLSLLYYSVLREIVKTSKGMTSSLKKDNICTKHGPRNLGHKDSSYLDHVRG